MSRNSFQLKKLEKREKFFLKILTSSGTRRGTPFLGLPSRISKNPSAIQRKIPKEGTMQNFSQFGPVGLSGEGLGMKKGHSIFYYE